MSPVATTVFTVRVSANDRHQPINRSLMTYILEGPILPHQTYDCSQTWTSVIENARKYKLTPCLPMNTSCMRVSVADMLAVRPTLKEETHRKEILVFAGEHCVNRMGDTTLQPWLHPIQLTLQEHTMFLNAIPAIDAGGIDLALNELRKVVRSADGYADDDAREDVKRVFASCIPSSMAVSQRIEIADVVQLFSAWRRALVGTCRITERRLEEVVHRLLHSYHHCAMVFRELALNQSELIARIDTRAIRAALMLMLVAENHHIHDLDTQSPCVFTLQQAVQTSQAVQLVAKDAFDPASYCTTFHPQRLPPVLSSSLEVFRQRLNTFLTGDAETDPFRDANWTNMAISGSVMTWALTKRSLRSGFTKQQELELYQTSDVDIPCSYTNLGDFLNHVHDTIGVIERNLGCTGTVEMNRSAKIYVEVDRPFGSDRRAIPNVEQFDAETNEQVIARYRAVVAEVRDKSRSCIRHDLDAMFVDVPEDQIACTAVKIESDYFGTVMNYAYCGASSPRYSHIPDAWLTYRDERPSDNEIYVKQSVKIRYSNPRLSRSLEFFPTSKHAVAHVAGYHLECVRAVYDGAHVYLTTSALIAYCTGKTFSPWGNQTGTHAKIVNKYANRGFQVNYCADQLDTDQLRASDQSGVDQLARCQYVTKA